VSREARSFLLGAAVAVACALALTLVEFTTYYQGVRSHQDLGNEKGGFHREEIVEVTASRV
jgi:hypothetical protein